MIRGYSDASISEAFGSFKDVDRQSLYASKCELISDKRSYPLVTEFNPRLPKVSKILNRHKHVLELNPDLCKILDPKSIFASYRQPKSIKSMLTRSKFLSDPDNRVEFEHPADPNFGSISCKKCNFCKNYLVECTSFKSYECSKIFQIKSKITCTTPGIINLNQRE